MNGYTKPILGVVLALIAAGIGGWVKFVTASSMDYRSHEATRVEERKAYDAQILRLKEKQDQRDRVMGEHLRKIYQELKDLNDAVHNHDMHRS